MNTTERDFSAHEILDVAGKLLGARGVDYDSEGGERSAARIAAAYNAVKGKKILEAGDVYLIHDLTKKVRQESASGYHVDSGDDATAYAALTAEAKAEDDRRLKAGKVSQSDAVAHEEIFGG